MKELVLDAIKELNKELKLKELEKIDENTNFFEILDSMAILDLILEIEKKIEEKYGKYIQIADENTMDVLKSPFRNFNELVKYLEGKVNG